MGKIQISTAKAQVLKVNGLKKADTDFKKEISRLRSEVRQVQEQKSKEDKPNNNFRGVVTQPTTGNYWTQTGLPWV